MTPKGTDGGPAFPRANPLEHWGSDTMGMSLWEWFAGQALAGWSIDSQGSSAKIAAEWACKVADAMIVERDKRLSK